MNCQILFSGKNVIKYQTLFSETICVNQFLFSGKNKKKNINLSSTESSQRVVKVDYEPEY